MSKFLSQDQVQNLLNRREASASELAEEFGKSRRRVEQIRRAHGQISPRFLTSEDRQQIAELRMDGLSHARIAATVGRATSTVRLVLAEQRPER